MAAMSALRTLQGFLRKHGILLLYEFRLTTQGSMLLAK